MTWGEPMRSWDESEADRNERSILVIAYRRKWIIAAAVVLATVIAVLVTHGQTPLYQASAEVLIGDKSLTTALTGVQNATQDPSRVAQTEADLARVPVVAKRALVASRVKGATVAEFLAASKVFSEQNSNLLVFRVKDSHPTVAARLATEYAHQFTLYRHELDRSAINGLEQEVAQRIEELRTKGDQSSALYSALVDKELQLRTIQALQTSNVFLVQAPAHVEKVAPRPIRNGVLGAAVGLLVGFGVAFLRERFDKRVRKEEEIQEALGLPLLARIPRPPRRLTKRSQLVMLTASDSVHAEAFRSLRAQLSFMNSEGRDSFAAETAKHCRSVMFTSAVAREGKSLASANLAIAVARSGRQVLLLDLDLRRPSLDRLFGLGHRPGFSDAMLGRVDLDEAFTPVLVSDNRWADQNGARRRIRRRLQVMPAGLPIPDPGELFSSEEFPRMIEELSGLADLVLIDAPPLLGGSDALTVSGSVDGLILVTRLKVLERSTLNELERVLNLSPARKLGFILSGAKLDERYGESSYRSARPRKPDAAQRPPFSTLEQTMEQLARSLYRDTGETTDAEVSD
jgi:capsular exopolysaccharide synthesis family protein